MLIGASVRCECGGLISIELQGPQNVSYCQKCKKEMSMESWEELKKSMKTLGEYESMMKSFYPATHHKYIF